MPVHVRASANKPWVSGCAPSGDRLAPMRTPRNRNLQGRCRGHRSRAAVRRSQAASTAASDTVRHIGPAVSWRGEIGTTPLPLTTPHGRLDPTNHSTRTARIDPLVSVPMAAAQKLAAAATAEPALEPEGLRSRA